MLVLPLKDSKGLLFNHSLIEQTPIDAAKRAFHVPDEAAYRVEGGMVLQCCHCRRVARPADPLMKTWDWIPAWVEKSPPRTSHSICPFCSERYYSQYR